MRQPERLLLTEPSFGVDYPELLPGNVDRLAALEAEAVNLESVALSPAQLADLALILNGAYRPLQGYMTQTDYESVLESLRLADGPAFPLPVVLDVDMTTAHAMETGKRIALRDGEGVAFALLNVENVWRKDPRRESQLLGVSKHAYGRGSCYLGGTVEGIRLPAHPFFAHLRPTPLTLKSQIRRRGVNRVLGVECGALIRRSHHQIITRAAAELDAAILLQPAVGTPDPGSPDQVVMIKSLLAALPYFPPRTTLLALLEYPVRRSGIREYLMHALLRKRFGATHFIMTGATQRAIDSEPRWRECLTDVGIEAVAWPERGFIESGGPPAPLSPNEQAAAILDHAGLAERLRSGEEISTEDVFPEVRAVLDAHYRAPKGRGFTLFFTGLSGSGKSTIAKIVHARIVERDPRPATLLDGDVVRKQFSKGLGFSKQDRDTNVRRIGAAAADITKRGGIAVCCPIAPYAETRKSVRAMIEPHGEMVEIHVATPLEVCERRDPKGLYKKAREGRIPNFTGVTDPYEAPQRPDLSLDASKGTPDAAAERVVAHLENTGLIARQTK